MDYTQAGLVAVAGAGAAGIACALSAAQQGKPVVLLEKQAAIGGTVAQALIHTLGGLFDEQGGQLNPGLPADLVERLMQASTFTQQRRIGKTLVLDVDPAVYLQVVRDWLAGFPKLDVYCQTQVTSLSVQNGQVEQITLRQSDCQPDRQSDQVFTLKPRLLIDTTGHAALVRQAGQRVQDGEVLAGLILQLRGMAPNALQFPKGAAVLRQIRQAVTAGALPSECATLWLDAGVYPDEAYAKFNLLPQAYKQQRMQQVTEQLLTWLRNIAGFEQVHLYKQGQLGLREGGQITGEYTLTENDLRQGQGFPDTVCQGNWPIEYWDPMKGVSLDYFPTGHRYSIPLRALKVANMKNLYVAGKCLSAEPRAQASVRVAGTCWAMGDGLMHTLLSGAKPHGA